MVVDFPAPAAPPMSTSPRRSPARFATSTGSPEFSKREAHLHRKRARDRSRRVPTLAMQINTESSETRDVVRRIGNLHRARYRAAATGVKTGCTRASISMPSNVTSPIFLHLAVFANRGSNSVHQKQVTTPKSEQLPQKIMQLGFVRQLDLPSAECS